MTTTLLDRIAVEDITARARRVPFWRSVFRLLTTAVFIAGWLAAKGLGLVWLAVAWAWASWCEGWEAAHGPSRGKQIEMLAAERDRLREELRRLGG